MKKPEFVEGYFLPIDPATWTTLCEVMKREGYTGDAAGVARFLSEVADGKLDPDEQDTEDAAGGLAATLSELGKKHGPALASVLKTFVSSRKGG